MYQQLLGDLASYVSGPYAFQPLYTCAGTTCTKALTTDSKGNIVQIVGRKAGRYALNQSQVMAPMQPSPQGQGGGASPSMSVAPQQPQQGGGSQQNAPSDQSTGNSSAP